LLLEGRAMVTVLGILTGLLVFVGAREIFGALGGLVSLALFAVSPDMLAFGGIVSTDMSICLMLLGSTWCIWRLLHRVTWGRVLAVLVFLPLLFLAKATALVIFPITVVLAAVKIISGRPLEWRLGRQRTIHSCWAQAKIFFALFLLGGLACWASLWAHYDFRYAASPNPADPGIRAWERPPNDAINPSVQAFLIWDRRWHILPEGYLDGMEMLLTDNETRESFINGHWIVGGSKEFFPYAIWAKTSPALFLLLIFGLGGWWWQSRRGKPINNPPPPGRENIAPSFYDAVPYVVLIAVLLAVAIAQDINVAHRYILPIYPPIEILAGGSIGLLWPGRRRWAQGLAALLLIGYAASTISIYPNYLAYFSPTVGGSDQDYKRLVESSLDWGMDLPSLKTWLDQHNPRHREKFYLAYFGTDNPDYYGIRSTRLPSFPTWAKDGQYDFNPGIYAISATIFESFFIQTRGPWNQDFERHYQDSLKNLRFYEMTRKDPVAFAALLKIFTPDQWLTEYNAFKELRFGRLCAWLRHGRAPEANINHTILIWNLSQQEIDDALYGPPAELAEAPLWGQIKPGDQRVVN